MPSRESSRRKKAFEQAIEVVNNLPSLFDQLTRRADLASIMMDTESTLAPLHRLPITTLPEEMHTQSYSTVWKC
jgi:hypothetical protein